MSADPRDGVVVPLWQPDMEREPPAVLELEQDLLGALLVHNDLADDIRDIVAVEDFADSRHQRIFETTLRAIDQSIRAKGVHALNLKHYFADDTALTEVGGPEYLTRLTMATSGRSLQVNNAEVIADMARRRRLIGFAADVSRKAYAADPTVSAREIIEGVEKELFVIAEAGPQVAKVADLRESAFTALRAAQAARAKGGGLVGVTSGLADLDKALGGWRPGEVVIIGARPGMGKTAAACGMGMAAAASGVPVHLFSMEMPADQIGGRLMAAQAGVPSEALRLGTVTDEEIDRLAFVAAEFGKLPFTIDDRPALKVQTIRSTSRRAVRRSKVGLIIVDYLQLAHADNRRDNRVAEITEISQGLKGIAKECGVPMLVLAQLSRQVENREDKRPQLSDLRESGAIEQDADQIIFVYREAYYAKQKNDHTADPRLTELIIAKNRHGPTQTVTVDFDGPAMRFMDRAQPELYDGSWGEQR